ncbi:hypothetical protein ACFPN0_32120 [Kitasatospora cinereorecta]
MGHVLCRRPRSSDGVSAGPAPLPAVLASTASGRRRWLDACSATVVPSGADDESVTIRSSGYGCRS